VGVFALIKSGFCSQGFEESDFKRRVVPCVRWLRVGSGKAWFQALEMMRAEGDGSEGKTLADT
jgi:hypothetical protein